MVMSQFRSAAHQRENDGEENRSAARRMILPRSHEGNQCSHNQSSDQPADVRSIVDPGQCESKNQVVDDKRPEAAQRAGKRRSRHGKLA